MSQRGWIRVGIVTTNREAVAGALFGAGASAIQDDPSELIAFAHGAAEVDRLSAAALAIDASAGIRTTDVPDVDWTQQWKHGLTIRRVGRMTIAPPWLAEGLDPRETVIIDPGMAFGTGDHASTRGALAQLIACLRAGDRVADLGAGSAVLAIAAAKLGAARVTAIEIDPDAITNAEENVVGNGVTDRVTIIQGDAPAMLCLVAPVDLITANIISGVIVELLPTMQSALTKEGRVVVAGILESERESVVETFERGGWRLLREAAEEGWWSGTIARA